MTTVPKDPSKKNPSEKDAKRPKKIKRGGSNGGSIEPPPAEYPPRKKKDKLL